MLLAIHASAPILIAVIARAFTSSRHHFLMRLKTYASPHPALIAFAFPSSSPRQPYF